MRVALGLAFVIAGFVSAPAHAIPGAAAQCRVNAWKACNQNYDDAEDIRECFIEEALLCPGYGANPIGEVQWWYCKFSDELGSGGSDCIPI